MAGLLLQSEGIVPNVRLLELRNTYKWGGGPDKTILLSAERHDPQRVAVTVAYVRDVRDREFRIGEKARSRGLRFCEIPERGKFDPRVLRAIREIVLRNDINVIHAHDYRVIYLLSSSDAPWGAAVRYWCRRHTLG